MLTIWGAPSGRFCDGITRRGFLSAGTLGVAGLTLADILRLRAQAGTAERSPKSVIMVWMAGGPSHIDTYDMKPDAPAEFRGALNPMATNVPGFDVCELLPLQAKIADKLCLMRTVNYRPKSHNVSELVCGDPVDEFATGTKRPAFGSVVSFHRGSKSAMPPFVNMISAEGRLSADPVYLGAAHRAFTPGSSTVANLGLHGAINPSRFEERKDLLGVLDTLRRDVDDRRGTLAGASAYTARALDMIGNPRVRDAFDISKETERVRAKFSGTYSGTQALQAIRLAEAGVGVVTLAGVRGADWDLHSGPTAAAAAQQAEKNNKEFRRLTHDHDRLVHAMVSELYDRGLEKDVAIIFWGEMGRTPRIKNGGRDHWDLGFAVLAGGGFRSGQVIGKTSPRAEFAVERPYTVQNVLATLYTHLGIDPNQNLQDLTGRPIPLLDDTRTVAEL